MRSRVTKLAFILVAFVVHSGCGKSKDYQERYLKLREEHEKEIAQLQAQREKENQDFERKLRQYEARMNTLQKKLGRQEELLAGKEAKAQLPPEQLPGGERQMAESEIEQLEGDAETALDAESPPSPASQEKERRLKSFVEDYASQIEEARREQFKKDFSEYIAGLREQPSDLTVFQRREKMLESLQQKISETADAGEREELKGRLEKIQNASDDDLNNILAYYQKLDAIRDLRKLMDEYNISREELRERGVEPPPRDTWAPDVKEIAFNLKSFVNSYEPLTDLAQREQYRSDFEKYLSDLTVRPTDEQVLQQRDQMLAALEERAQTASDQEKSGIERRIRSLKNADLDDLRRSLQASKLRGLSELVEKYNLPNDELRQSGVLLSRRRSPTRR